mmetsp:Transcript_20912/g.59960  ORF Transcript_20912/g.59960 Transcript_20912/m.59960 type:complete len:533 (-) Transcript_20912:4975-6573(-)
MKFLAQRKPQRNDKTNTKRQTTTAAKIMTATLLLGSSSSRAAFAAATASGLRQRGTSSFCQSSSAVSSLGAFVPTRSVSALALDAIHPSTPLVAANKPTTSFSPHRPLAFGLEPFHYRSSLTRQFSASGGSSSGEESADVALEHQEKKRYPTLTAAALADTNLSSNIHMYDLPPPPSDIITDLEPGRRIVAFGDVHGDIEALKSFLVIAGVMDPLSSVEEPVWSGDNTICVQCGDILDRGDDELACFRLLTSLSRQARDAGGELILLYGNHESLNTVGLFQYANNGGNLEFERDIGASIDAALDSNRWRLMFAGNQASRWSAFEPGGLLAANLLANMKVSVVVGRTIFVHAGLTASHVDEYGSIEGMNKAARNWILQPHHGEHDYVGTYETVAEVVESAQKRARGATKKMPNCLGGGTGEQSPVWMRNYSSPNDTVPKDPRAQQLIDEALEKVGHGVQRMVMGHTPQHRINAALKGKAWRVDVGASRGVMHGRPEVLEIVHGGEGEEDAVSILTTDGEKVDSSDRQVVEMPL